MTESRYPVEIDTECGTMDANVAELAQAVVGHRIVSAVKAKRPSRYDWMGDLETFVLTLDDGTEVWLEDSGDCCAYTELDAFLLHPEMVDHVIIGVGTENDFQVWHIYADLGDVLTLTVGWSSGNPCYYGYGFDIRVTPLGAS